MADFLKEKPEEDTLSDSDTDVVTKHLRSSLPLSKHSPGNNSAETSFTSYSIKTEIMAATDTYGCYGDVETEKYPKVDQSRHTDDNANFTGTLNTDSSTGTSKQTIDYKCDLTVREQSKLERELSKKTKTNSAPPKFVVVFKWITLIFFGCLNLACLVCSRLSFVAVAVRQNQEDNMDKCYAFTMTLMILLIPNLFNLLRSLWMGLSRKDMPWPSKKSIIWIIGTCFLESFGICLFAFKILPLSYGVSGLLLTNAVFFGPIIYLMYRRNRTNIPDKVTKSCSFALVLLLISVGISVWRGYTVVSVPVENFWHIIVAALCLNVSWLPRVQKRLISISGSEKSKNDKFAQAKNRQQSEEVKIKESMYENSDDIEKERFQVSIDVEDNHVNTKENDEIVDMKTHSVWKSSIIVSACRVPFVIAFSVILYFVDTDKTFIPDAMESFRNSWSNLETDEDAFIMLIINIISTLVAYFISLLACRITMQRGAFVAPLMFVSPAAVALLSFTDICGSSYFQPSGGTNSNICSSDELAYNLAAAVCLLLALCLSFGWILWTTDIIVMCSESEVFWLPSYPGILLSEWMLLSRRNRITEITEAPQYKARKTKVYICTTMYRETRDEMAQLLKSIGRIKDAQASSDKYFESHIFFDGGVKDKVPTDFALQLVSLLPETLGVLPMMCTRSMTPYGMKLSWQLSPGNRGRAARGMTFTIHLKDNRKVKNKKRWSQIMYMSYVIDFLIKQYVNAAGNNEVDDNDAFILTTDADVNFTPESVEALLDMMTRDQTVGAVCARTHPIGFGPLVWYQKFEYAIGHWFQKAAEDVLGSVLCAPGCFSVYRVRAVRDIVSTYSSNVEKAFEFLIKDMGEDRWFCTLLVQSGWRIEYCATSENKTQCPEEFDEFYKQRRRWIASTIANLMLLVREWKLISRFNHRVSFLFTIYQGLLLFSTLIGPSVVIMVVSGGLVYAWGVNSITTIILQSLVCVGFATVCLYYSETTQMRAAKLLTFLYSCVMMAVAVGTAQQVVSDLNTDKPVSYFDNNTGSMVSPTLDPSDNFLGLAGNWNCKPITSNYELLWSLVNPATFVFWQKWLESKAAGIERHILYVDLPISLTSLYLGCLIGIFFVAGVLHPREFFCLFHGFWYLLCLPSGYLILNIYSICNITDRSWGTREEKSKSVVKDMRPWYEILGEKIRAIFNCCRPGPPQQTHEGPTPTGRVRNTSVTDIHGTITGSARDVPKTIPETGSDEIDGSAHKYSLLSEEEMLQADQYFPDDIKPIPVEQWLDQDLREEYVPLFKKHGFDSTLFISGMKEKDLTSIGIKKKTHVTNLMERIKDLPEFRIEVKVPDNIKEWLMDIGLSQYYDVFRQNKITGPKDLEILKSFSRKEIETELKITKAGHVVRLLTAIKHLREPTAEELMAIDVKKALNFTELYNTGDVNLEEHVFWQELREACLKPGSMAFGQSEGLKEKLGELRNNFLGILAVSNTLWLILLSTLASKMELKVFGTDPIGLVFLGIFGFLLVLQFLCMLVHRVMTFSHFCARAPYKFGQNYNSTWKFGDSYGESLSDEDKQAIHHAREGDIKIKNRLKSRGRHLARKPQTISEENTKLLGTDNRVPYNVYG